MYADLGSRAFSNGDRGLFGLALDPSFPARPFVYVLYTFDGPVGGRKPLGRGRCEGLFDGACPVSGRLSRIEPDGAERVLVSGWCQQYPSHGVGDLTLVRTGCSTRAEARARATTASTPARPATSAAIPPARAGRYARRTRAWIAIRSA